MSSLIALRGPRHRWFLAFAAVVGLHTPLALARAEDVVLGSFDDVLQRASFDPASRTYRLEADRILVTGDVAAPLDALVPANLTLIATSAIVVEAGGALRADSGDINGAPTQSGAPPAGTISVTAPEVILHGAVTAKGGNWFSGSTWGFAGHGGQLLVQAGTLLVDGTLAANGGSANGHFGDTSGLGGTIRIAADRFELDGAVTANSDYGVGWGYHGGTIEILARERGRLSGAVAANGGQGGLFYAGNGGSVTVTGGAIAVAGTVSADGSAGGYWGTAGRGGSIVLEAAQLELSGRVTANGALNWRGVTSPGGLIQLAYGSILPADEPLTRVHVAADPGGTIAFNPTDLVPPIVRIVSPTALEYPHLGTLLIEFTATDDGSGVASVAATLDDVPVANGESIDLLAQGLGAHTLKVVAVDGAGNGAEATTTFTLVATPESAAALAETLSADGEIAEGGIVTSLEAKAQAAVERLAAGEKASGMGALRALLNEIRAQAGKSISLEAAAALTAEIEALLLAG